MSKREAIGKFVMNCPQCKKECANFGFYGPRRRWRRYRCDSCGQAYTDYPHGPLGRCSIPLSRIVNITNLSVEGVGINAIARLTKTNKNTVQRVLEKAGSKCAFFLDQRVRNVTFPFVQVDELFCFVGCKEKNNQSEDPERGRQSIFLGVDAESKFIINWMVGKRTSPTIEKYMQDLKLRVKTPFQLTTDGYELFEDEVKWVFYGDVHYGQVTKKFVHPKGSKSAEGRYEPSRVGKIYKRAVFGAPWLHKISTSYVDRTHLSLRLFNRRFSRLTLGFSKSLQNLKYSVALFIAHFDFCRVHGTLRGQTPAMAAGLTDHIWSVAELLTESGQVGTEKWFCPLSHRTIAPSLRVFKAA